MPSLRETQLAFASGVLGRDAYSMHGLVIEGGFSTSERMRVYRNNARIGFHSALRAAFPVIEQLGGIDWFEAVAQRYQQHHPSRCGDLQYVGDRFAQFLLADLSGTDYEWFSEVARLEWAYQEVLVAPESPAFDPMSMAALTSEQQEHVVFVPRRELRLLRSTVPVLSIWKAHQPGIDVPTFSFDGTERHTLLLRRDDHVELRDLPPDQALLLDAFVHGEALLSASQRLLVAFPGVDMGQILRRLVQLQALSAIRIPHH